MVTETACLETDFRLLSMPRMVASLLGTVWGQWVPAIALEAVGGRQAWRTRVSDARRVYGMRIENRCRRVQREGVRWTLSEYRWMVED